MQLPLVLLVLFLVVVLVVLPIWVIVKIFGHDREFDALQKRLHAQDGELRDLRAALHDKPVAAVVKTSGTAPSAIPIAVPLACEPPPVPGATPMVSEHRSSPLVGEPLPVVFQGQTSAESFEASDVPPPLLGSPVILPAADTPLPQPPKPSINWEQFMGAKLFAWLGGLALFLGVAFFVKYSFEHNLIPPEVRVALGFLFGAGLIIGGMKVSLDRYRITAQTLVASGVVSLYAVTFSCDSIYHFAFFGPVSTFLLMSLITAAAFVLAVRLDAQVVAILGILGGFLTPVLINTGHDNPAGLFGYLAILVAGLSAVALHRRWLYLVPLGAGGTVLMLLAWTGRFYVPEKTGIAMVVCLGFCAITFLVYLAARRLDRASPSILWSAVGLPAVSLAFALFFAEHPLVAAHPGFLLPFIFACDAFLLALAWLDERVPRLHLAAGLAVFALLSIWTAESLTDALLLWSLAANLLFAALHAAFPLLLERRRPASAASWLSQLFPPLALLLMVLPLYKFETVSLLVWPAILLVDVIAIGVALLGASLVAVAAVLVLTLGATALCILRVPSESAFEPSLLLVIGGFAVFFFFAGLWLVRRLGGRITSAHSRLAGLFGGAQSQIPALSSLLPFLLMIMVCARLNVPNPSTVFGLGLLLVILTLGLARLLMAEWLPACALAGVAALEFAWHVRHFNAEAPGLPLGWYAGFYAVFAAYPFVFRRDFIRLTGPWAVAALSGPAHFWMIYQAIKLGWPNELPGMVPAVFTLAPLGGLFVILRTDADDSSKRLNQLAWFGGVVLFFITLIFPIQFDRQWLTVAWALEGAALLWLFHRVPHPGLRATGTVLLGIAFVRLALNPAVLEYHLRGDRAVFNWYLYAYGLAIVSLFAGARLLAPPRQTVFGINVQPILNTLGVILAFLLLNIEIADYFTLPGTNTLTFEFSGNFARDMCYTIGWALFALGLLSVGIWKRQRGVRYAAIALLSAALLKLFFHDLAQLEALYRIGALFAVAVIAILASFAYQRFLPTNEKPLQTPP
jgi:uncharacterized membrane protein